MSQNRKGTTRKDPSRSFKVAALFAGIGGIELGLERASHKTVLLCENDRGAMAVLKAHFKKKGRKYPLFHSDVNDLMELPRGVDLLTAGFPCQDLSQAGTTNGIEGSRSGLVGEALRLAATHATPWLLLENVPFMLQLARGRAMAVVVDALEELGYKWAYRIVDSRAFGLPQRRRRVYLVASLIEDPRTVLFADDAGPPDARATHEDVACGFYWTEGIRGLGWAVDAIPTLKGGSTIGIPSPPAILMPDGRVIKPDLRDSERLQGFRADWTRPAVEVGRDSLRWKLVGNAVSVPASKWIGQRLATPGKLRAHDARPLNSCVWPTNAWNVGEGRFTSPSISEWPKRLKQPSLTVFLNYPGESLSARATAGFLGRTKRAKLRFPDGFIAKLERHLLRMQDGSAERSSRSTQRTRRASHERVQAS